MSETTYCFYIVLKIIRNLNTTCLYNLLPIIVVLIPVGGFRNAHPFIPANCQVSPQYIYSIYDPIYPRLKTPAQESVSLWWQPPSTSRICPSRLLGLQARFGKQPSALKILCKIKLLSNRIRKTQSGAGGGERNYFASIPVLYAESVDDIKRD